MTTLGSSSLSSANSAAFDAWARVYDTQPNPLLSLEERFLKCLLPPIDDKDILDVGCGTGRWLVQLAGLGSPRSLCGIDSSDEMLAVARHKSFSPVSLLHAQLPFLPSPSGSIDLALASFVLSYIPDIDTCARELRRVLRDDADLFIADMHPATASEFGWRRSFNTQLGTFNLNNNHRSIDNVIRSMAQHGLQLVAFHQPSFGDPEYSIFLSQGRESSFQDVATRPAIYLLHFKRCVTSPVQSDVCFKNANCVWGGEESTPSELAIQRDRVTTISPLHTHIPADNHVDLSGYTLYPGLINAHDHLEFALFPQLGKPPYGNATDWAHDIQYRFRDIIATHKQIPKAVRLWWGALRNLLSGVTTVCHHNPYHSAFSDPEFPIRVATNFGWEHSLAFAKDLTGAYDKTPSSHPFILHVGEGIDISARNEFVQLQDLHLLSNRIVMIHGLALSLAEISVLNEHGASLISCPSSNQFLFLKTPSREYLDCVSRLAIGSDSPLTAAGDLLDEIGFCSRHLHLSPQRLFECVTKAPARILRLRRGEGCITPGGPADFFAVRNSTLTPAKQLSSLSWRDVELVMTKGIIRLASTEMIQRLPSQLSKHLSCLLIDGVPRWIAAPVDTLFKSAAEVLGASSISLNGRPTLSARGV
jgi:cytosine/adenosine deaminase-related metal-dependent hydrolase/ubiquinone/menaquinone biosynthesis C-methylase UbiE